MTSQTTLVRSLLAVKGNASQEIKEGLARTFGDAVVTGPYFMAEVCGRMEATEMNIVESVEEPGKLQARIVFEMDVVKGEVWCLSMCAELLKGLSPDMCNVYKILHGGCVASLIDVYVGRFIVRDGSDGWSPTDARLRPLALSSFGATRPSFLGPSLSC